MTTQPIYQADKHWAKVTLGHGPSTIGRKGCMLACLTMAARILETRPAILPPAANAALVAGGAFINDRIIPRLAAPALGLESPDCDAVRTVVCEPLLVDWIHRAMVDGLAILHIDHDGDGDGDHFILAYTMTPNQDRVLCLDPAIGRVQIGIPSLESIGPAVWGPKDHRTYRVCGVRAVRRAAQ